GLGGGGAGPGGHAGECAAVGGDLNVVTAGVVAAGAARVHLDLVERLGRAEVDLEVHPGGLGRVGAVPGVDVAVDGVGGRGARRAGVGAGRPAGLAERGLRPAAAAAAGVGGEFGDGPPVGDAGGGEHDPDVLGGLRGEGDGLGGGGAGPGGHAGECAAVGGDLDVVTAGVVAAGAARVHLDLVE